jgi:hypothetical protein
MLSPISPDTQFQLKASYPANLDRCRRCGYPRKLHGNDGSCGLTFPASRVTPVRLVIPGAMLGAIGVAVWLLVSTTTATISSAAAFAVLVSLILLAGGVALTERRR